MQARTTDASAQSGDIEPTHVLPVMWQEKESVYVIKRTREEADVQDESYGYVDFKEGEEKIGWMVTYSQV
jgi:hypothetical protein